MPVEPDRGMEVMGEGFSQRGRACGLRTLLRAPSRGGAEGFLAGGRLGASGMSLRRWMLHLPMEAPRGGGTMVSNGEESWINGVEQKIAGIAEGRGGSARTEKRKGVQLFARG
jgi:hypothetical protein